MTEKEFKEAKWSSKTIIKMENSILTYPVLAVSFIDGEIEVSEDCFVHYQNCEIVKEK